MPVNKKFLERGLTTLRDLCHCIKAGLFLSITFDSQENEGPPFILVVTLLKQPATDGRGPHPRDSEHQT